MIPLHRTPIGKLQIGRGEPSIVERGLVVHVKQDLRPEITSGLQISRAFKICSPHTNWKKPRWGDGRMYRQFPQDEILAFGVGSILVKPLARYEGEWTDYLDIPKYRNEKHYQNGKDVQWCGVAPKVFHPAELLTTNDFLAECQKLREQAKEQAIRNREAQAREQAYRNLEDLAKELGYDLKIDEEGAIRFKENTLDNLGHILNDLHMYYTQEDC